MKKYTEMTAEEVGYLGFDFIRATASQRAEAFLATVAND